MQGRKPPSVEMVQDILETYFHLGPDFGRVVRKDWEFREIRLYPAAHDVLTMNIDGVEFIITIKPV